MIYQGRTEGMNQWKSAHAVDTPLRTLAEAVKGADVLLGLSAKGAFTPEIIASMAPNPVIFAMANPDPEITPEEVHAVRKDAIMGTGRSDYPNQVNNVLGFPYIFRGALDVRARRVNHEMKIACANALAMLAREDVPDEVAAAYHGRQLKFGPQYIIPSAFDPRLIWYVPPFVAQAAMDTGVARKPIVDIEAYVARLEGRLDPIAGWLQSTFSDVRENPKRMVFAEGEEPAAIRAAHSYYAQGFGVPILIGSVDAVREQFRALGMSLRPEYQIIDTRKSGHVEEFTNYLYARLQRRGYLRRDCQRLVANDRNVFGALMVAHGLADGLVTGVTRNWRTVFEDVQRVLDPEPGRAVIGVSLAIARGRAVLVADTSVHEVPDATQLADIAIEAARAARKFGMEPRGWPNVE